MSTNGGAFYVVGQRRRPRRALQQSPGPRLALGAVVRQSLPPSKMARRMARRTATRRSRPTASTAPRWPSNWRPGWSRPTPA